MKSHCIHSYIPGVGRATQWSPAASKPVPRPDMGKSNKNPSEGEWKDHTPKNGCTFLYQHHFIIHYPLTCCWVKSPSSSKFGVWILDFCRLNPSFVAHTAFCMLKEMAEPTRQRSAESADLTTGTSVGKPTLTPTLARTLVAPGSEPSAV